ncbi:hypothetical protein Vafri_10974, partial [Volvox africanus]
LTAPLPPPPPPPQLLGCCCFLHVVPCLSRTLQALARLPLLQHVTLGSLDIAPDEDYEDLLLHPDDTLNDRPWVRFMDTWRSFHHAAGGQASETSTSCEMASGSSSWPGSNVDACFVNRFGGNAVGGCNSGAEGNGDGNGGGGNGGGGNGGDGSGSSNRSGVLRSMTSWRQLVLCEEQRMEALVAAGPLPPGLRELRVEQLRWPRCGWRVSTTHCYAPRRYPYKFRGRWLNVMCWPHGIPSSEVPMANQLL